MSGGAEAMAAAALAELYRVLAERRNAAWTVQNVLASAGGFPEEMPEPTDREAWWYAQGRAEALAKVMTILEQGVPGLPALGGPDLLVTERVPWYRAMGRRTRGGDLLGQIVQAYPTEHAPGGIYVEYELPEFDTTCNPERGLLDGAVEVLRETSAGFATVQVVPSTNRKGPGS